MFRTWLVQRHRGSDINDIERVPSTATEATMSWFTGASSVSSEAKRCLWAQARETTLADASPVATAWSVTGVSEEDLERCRLSG